MSKIHRLKSRIISPTRRALSGAAVVVASATSWMLPQMASAAITITNITGASNVVGLTTLTNSTTPTNTTNPIVTSTPIIYGGIAGALSRCDQTQGQQTCDNCKATVSGTGDAKLIACNTKRVYDGLILTISLSSSTADGYAAIYPPATISAPASTQITAVNQSTAVVSHGSTTQVQVLWSTICPYLVTTDTQASLTSCALPTSAPATAQFQVGIVAVTQSTLPGATPTPTGVGLSDAVTVAITLAQDVGQAATLTANPSAVTDESLVVNDGSSPGVYHFSVRPGDAEVELDNTLAVPGFPTTTAGVPFQAVKVLYSTTGFADIGADSPSSTLTINTNTGTDSSTSFSISPNRVTGLTNETPYYFKIATVDAANNVGYYTAAANDEDCNSDDVVQTQCHETTPGVVVGLLAKNLNCFIATAAYGSKMAPQVKTFRQFRDRILLHSRWGYELVKFYYAHSPKYAAIIAQHEGLRTASRILLWPVLGYVWLTIKFGFLQTTLSLFALLAAGLLLRRRSRARA